MEATKTRKVRSDKGKKRGPRKTSPTKKSTYGRRALDWRKPESFATAAQRIAKTYNSYVDKNIAESVARDQLENIKSGLGYTINPETGKKTLPVFDVLYDMGKNGKLKVKDTKAAQKIYELQAKSNKVKVVSADEQGNEGKIIDDKSRQRIRTVYETTPTSAEYIKSIKTDVLSGYADSDLTDKERAAYAGTIKATVQNLKKQNPHIDDAEARKHAKQIVTATDLAVKNEMARRASFDKTEVKEMDKLFREISEAIEHGKLQGDNLDRALSLVYHSGYQSTHADINELQGIRNLF